MTISNDISGSEAVIVGGGGAGGVASGDPSDAASIISANPPTLPLTIVAGVNDEFNFAFDSFTFVIAPGTYTNVPDLVTAFRHALYLDDPTRDFETVTGWSGYNQSGTNIGISSPTVGGGSQYNGYTITDGTHNALPGLGFTNGQEASGGTDGSEDGLPGSDGFVIHVLN